MPSSRPQVFGLSRDVTLAVLPRLYMQEVLIELGRRDIDFRQVLISTLHDVMVREYQQLDIQSEPTAPDVMRHVTRRVGYSYYDPSLWTGELVGRRGPPVERFRETYLRETHMDAPTDLSMRPADSGEVKEPERRDTKESFHIVTEPRIDQGQWSHTHAYTEYNTTQETSHDDMTQVAENGKIFERPSSEKEDRSPVESREEYGRGPSTSSVSQDEEYRGREQEESNAALTSNTSGASPDTEPHDQHSQSSITTTSSTSTGPQETSTSQYQKKVEMDASDSTNRSLPLGARRINYWKGYSRRKITHDLPTLPVSQPYMPSSLSPLHISTASAQKVPTGKRKTDKEDACMPPTTAASDEATSSKRSKRHESGDVTVRHANGPTEPPVSSEKDMSPYQTPSENEIVPYRDLSVDAPSEEQIRPYWTQPKSPALHIEWVSSISKGSVESWKKDVEGKEESEKNPSDRKPSNSPETAEDSAGTANDLSKPASSVMQNKADTHRQTLQLESGAIPATQQSRPSKTRKKRKKVITAEPRQQENIRDPTEQAKPTIPEEEAVPTSRKTNNDDAKTSQSSLPTSLQEPGVSPQGREGMSHTRDFSLPVKLRQFALPGIGQRNGTSQYPVATSMTSKMPHETVDPYQRDGESAQNHLTLSKQAVKWLPMLDTRLHVLGWTRVNSDQPCSRNTEESTSTTSKMPREMVDSYQRDEESARKHFTLSKEVVSSLPMPETRLHGLAETRVYSDQPCPRNTEKDDENHVERTTTVSGMTSDIANCTPKEPETVDTNSHSSVLSSVLHEAPIYKRQEGHSGRSSMNLHSSAMAPEPIAYSERQVQANDTPAVPQPSVSSYHGQDGQSATETHMEHRPSEPTTSYERERRLNHETTLVNESSLVFPYRRTSDESPGTQSHSGSPSSVIREALPSYQKLVQVNGSTVWVPRSFAATSPLSFRPLHVNPGITGHAHESYTSPSSQIETIETRPQREPIPMESQEAMPNHHEVDNDGANSRKNQTSEEQNAYNDQPATFLTQKDINFVIKQEPLSPLSDTVNEEERELIQGVLSGASLAESLEQQMLESGDAPPREMDWQDLQETGADEGSSSEKSDGSRKLTKLYYCPLCSYFTRHRGNIKQHVRVHTRERPFKCPLCEYTGARKEHVQVHMKRHTGERPFKCDHCDYRTSRKPDLVKHLRTHSGDRPYACPKCAYRAAVQSALVNHLRTHTGEKPYKCPFCDYCTARKRDLSKHMERHSEDERCQAVEQYYYHLSSIDNTADDK